MTRAPTFERWRLAGCLRAVSALALAVLAAALFWQPLRAVLGPKIHHVSSRVPLPEILRPSGARGFTIRVVSEPTGAEVTIGGEPRGRAPFFGNVVCEDGQTVEIAVEKQGLPPWRRSVPCRVGKELTVRARLGE